MAETGEEHHDDGVDAGAQVAVEDAATTREAAVSVLQWAKERHLFSLSGMEESVETEEEEVAIEPQQAFSAQRVQDTFRKRSINLVGFNEAARTVVIFTKGKLSVAEKKFMPSQLPGGFGLDYIQGGVAQVRGNPPSPHNHRPYVEHNGRYCCGSSVYPANCIGAGTLGLLARDAAGALFGVSNNHVSGACNHAQPGLPILAPGPVDVSPDHREPFTIGRHVRLLPINDGIPENVDISVNWDGCCFELANPDLVTSMQGQVYDTPTEVADPVPGMQVEKVGRTTGHTLGIIVAQAASPVPVGYNVKEYGVQKTVFFEEVFIVHSQPQPFSKPGDSGSLAVSRDAQGVRRAVGLVFAGDPDRGLSFILPLRPILDKLELEIVGSHNI
jgi:hypothetical protein